MNLRDRIIRESLRLFSVRGFLGTSLADIMQASGTSKGGFYNHFRSKEALFADVLSESRKIWRDKNLAGLDALEDRPLEKIERLLDNYRGRYLRDTDDFPGGCVFIGLAVELSGRRPHLASEVKEGFVRLKAMIERYLHRARETGQIAADVDTGQLAEVIFAGMLGASLMYSLDRSTSNLDRTVDSLIHFLRGLAKA
jgi:TetR/AcrR family transcriptional regulator, transcriptional repressor for nem operon